MPVTNYYTIDGEITAEKTTGGSRVDYLTDALGSVTATMDQSAQVVNTYRYKPYGTQLAKTGVGSDPNFQWVGSQGYRQTKKKYSDVYVRARHYDTETARWITRDLRPSVNSYIYAVQAPTKFGDPSGLQVAVGGGVEAPTLPEVPGNGPQASYPFDPGGYFSIWLPYAISGRQAFDPRRPAFCPIQDPRSCESYGDLCAWANAIGLVGPQAGGFRHGTTVCCHGRVQACVADTSAPFARPTFGQPASINRPTNLWRSCIQIHERIHVGQSPLCLPGMVGRAQGNSDRNECVALLMQFNCLLNGASRACRGFTGANQRQCFNEVYAGLRIVCRRIRAVCSLVPGAPTSCNNVVEAYNPGDPRFSPY